MHILKNKKKKGKHSITEYRVLKTWKLKSFMYSLLDIDLHTGRTHQIRVVMSSLAHPVVGDVLYHKKSAKHNTTNLCLVAKKLRFNHPEREDEELSFEVDYPDFFHEFINFLNTNGSLVPLDEDNVSDEFKF
eukprot:TRINITY_DN10639_c0_g1_i1.p1 TRINITY_DN10639_c0_g1~~TRINITY_DN10639_c0_g1_i1.p1  ORF type:complete len:132 (-),score=26.81 TRINITY_DN10639_c0_g1_i1:112-507(-)